MAAIQARWIQSDLSRPCHQRAYVNDPPVPELASWTQELVNQRVCPVTKRKNEISPANLRSENDVSHRPSCPCRHYQQSFPRFACARVSRPSAEKQFLTSTFHNCRYLLSDVRSPSVMLWNESAAGEPTCDTSFVGWEKFDLPYPPGLIPPPL